jgi:TPR repeat protein
LALVFYFSGSDFQMGFVVIRERFAFLRLIRICCGMLLLVQAAGNAAWATQSEADDDIDLAEIVRRPAIGNYRGYAEFKMAHYAAAKRIWEALDQRDFGEAAFNLGILHEDGLGVPRNIDRALAYYRRGATLGSPKAMFRMGLIYWLGAPGVAVDRGEGRRYLSMAAEAGDSEAKRYLATDGNSGDLADPVMRADRALAEGNSSAYVAILSSAAESGHARAQTRLAWSYESGRGVGRDLDAAARWFLAAAEQGDGEAMYALAVMHNTGAGRAKDPVLAEHWLKRSAAAQYPAALADLRQHQSDPTR